MSASFQVFGTMVSSRHIEQVAAYENTGALLYEVVIKPNARVGEDPTPIQCSIRVIPDRDTGKCVLPDQGTTVTGLGQIYGRQGDKHLFVHLQLRSLQVVGTNNIAASDIPL